MDRVTINGLKAYCIIGVNKWEREVPQLIKVGITFYFKTPERPTENIKDRPNYRTIAKEVQHHIENSSYFLLETLAENLASVVLHNKLIEKVEITVNKLRALRNCDSVAVTISRMRQ